jgi:uncharacterized protein (DUF1697 family)
VTANPKPWVLLLRAVNLGPTNKVPMAQLRRTLADRGHADVRTYLQSGNVVLRSPLDAADLAERVRAQLADAFGLHTDVIVRSAREITAVAGSNPFLERASDPARQLHVCFLADRPKPGEVAQLEQLPSGSEAVAVHGREVYLWCPDGIGRSPVFTRLGRTVRTPGTTRNWRTVLNLVELAKEK